MNRLKYKFLVLILLITSEIVSQKQIKTIDESFKVNKDVLVEIESDYSDVTVETWNKNVVAIKGTIETEAKGVSKEEIEELLKLWSFEALGNQSKVVVKSKPSMNYYDLSFVFGDFDFDFDLDSIIYKGELIDGDYFSNMPPMPELPPVPPLPIDISDYLENIEFDYDSFLEDKEKYLKEFEKKQEEWSKEFEKKYEPQMKQYEKQMKEWEKQIEPQMKKYEKEMEEKTKAMEIKMEQYEKQMKAEYDKKIESKTNISSNKYDVRVNVTIKVPKESTIKVNSKHGSVKLPSGIRTVN